MGRDIKPHRVFDLVVNLKILDKNILPSPGHGPASGGIRASLRRLMARLGAGCAPMKMLRFQCISVMLAVVIRSRKCGKVVIALVTTAYSSHNTAPGLRGGSVRRPSILNKRSREGVPQQWEISRGKEGCESLKRSWSPPPMDTHICREVISMFAILCTNRMMEGGEGCGMGGGTNGDGMSVGSLRALRTSTLAADLNYRPANGTLQEARALPDRQLVTSPRDSYEPHVPFTLRVVLLTENLATSWYLERSPGPHHVCT
ncbi:hypothetical protein EVAR_62705_1 [Eumeta japonica]|uniref:Uncharacterized protein n=1 Tax=Eumeta variegata TaxID=151549 RepID=A0A4C1ZM08_EUMVA|nr:hypothetical protein EVAR_62705_1 [Eumeta japonica]